MKYRLPLLFLAAALALSACSPSAASGSGPQAWIDDPLDGMVLPLAPHTLTLHGSDPHGISRMEVSINGTPLGTLINPDPAQLLFYQTLTWDPAEPGRYVISARARNTAGVWSPEDRVTVEIMDTLTDTPGATVTATPAATPTPTVTSAAMTFSSQASVREFYYQRDCIPDPDRVTFTVKAAPFEKIRNLYLFFRLASQDGSIVTDWENVVMAPIGGGSYRSTIVWRKIAGILAIGDRGLSAWFQYQFVADDSTGAILGRSAVLSDVILSPCD